MLHNFGTIICRHWIWVVVFWVVVFVVLRITAPSWDEITKDGDFQYLPAESPSVVGQKLLDEAFPNTRSRSQIVGVVARESGQPKPYDLVVSYEMARRFHNLAGVAAVGKGLQGNSSSPPPASLAEANANAEALNQNGSQEPNDTGEPEINPWFERAKLEFDQSIELTRKLFEFQSAEPRPGVKSPTPIPDEELAVAFVNRAQVLELMGRSKEAADDRLIAERLGVSFPEEQLFRPEAALEQPITDLWTWQSQGYGPKLIDVRNRRAYARLAILHLSTEFLALENVELFELIESQLDEVEAWSAGFEDPDLVVGVSGSAAVGSDLLKASAESIRHTELFTVLLVTLILAFVYRSPLLVGLPLVTIGISLSISICILSALTQLQNVPGFGWFDFNVYKTTKIFIVVILFGAGTDYCLFLVSRYREELQRGCSTSEAVSKTLEKVGDALIASALTTVLGLGMMFFAEFGKLRNSGPAIGICLLITLAACLTLAPAILRAFGSIVFWPSRIKSSGRTNANESTTKVDSDSQDDFSAKPSRFWQATAHLVTTHPGLILIVSYLLITPLAIWGFQTQDQVTYDMLRSLDPSRPSRQGAELLRKHFPVGESGPVIVLAQHPSQSFLQENGEPDFDKRARIDELAKSLSTIEGVQSVRSLTDPIGNGAGARSSIATTSIRTLPAIQAMYVTQQPEFDHRVARFEIVTKYDAFTIESTNIISSVEELLAKEKANPDSFWSEVQFSFAGTSAGIRDLRRVTQKDTSRIQVLVVIAVYVVLVIILRRPIICAYMIATVLISFFATMGITQGFFAWVDGDSFQGLDWRVPLFLFVILVAVGEDYNVYLAARIFEEQNKLGTKQGLKVAVARTGGIISSCGVIMAGTFISMTSGTWGSFLPAGTPGLSFIFDPEAGALQSIVQMGFALALGVMLDTFFVRPILLPAFVALMDRFKSNQAADDSQAESADQA